MIVKSALPALPVAGIIEIRLFLYSDDTCYIVDHRVLQYNWWYVLFLIEQFANLYHQNAFACVYCSVEVYFA